MKGHKLVYWIEVIGTGGADSVLTFRHALWDTNYPLYMIHCGVSVLGLLHVTAL